MYYIYKITCIPNNKIYIGQTNNYKRRLQEHKSSLSRGVHENNILQKDYDRYSLNKFGIEILDVVNTRKEALELEDYWINYYGGIENFSIYNKCDLHGHNKDYKNNQSKSQLGVHKISQEGRLKISKANKGKIISEKQKELIRKAAKSNPNYGMKNKQHTKSSKQKMSQAKKGMFLGESNPNFTYSKELEDKVKNCYKECKCYAEVARRFNLKPFTISYLVKRNI